MEKTSTMPIQFKNVLCLVAVKLYVAPRHPKPEDIFFQHLPTTVQFSKEATHITDQWVKVWLMSSLFHGYILLAKLKDQLTLKWELQLLINCDHRLATDIRVWQKSTKAFCENQLTMCGIDSKEYCIFHYCLQILCYLSQIPIPLIINGMDRYTHAAFYGERVVNVFQHIIAWGRRVLTSL